MKLAAYFYDGRSSRRHAADLQLIAGIFLLQGEWGERRFRHADVDISEPMGKAPRAIRFADGAHCEIPDAPAFAHMLAASGHRENLSVRLHSRWSWALGSLAVVACVVIATYLWVLPWGAEKLAPKIPQSVVEQLSGSVIQSLDGSILHPSKVPLERQNALREKMTAFAAQGQLPPYKLYFRSVKKMPPNAFALPNGDIVIFDSLLEHMSDDEALAVFGHELGHVYYRHGLRMMIQGTVVSTIVGLYLGDMSTIVAGLSTALLEADYSQKFESEADSFGAKALRRAAMSPMLLASALQILEKEHRQRGDPKAPKPEAEQKPEAPKEEGFLEHYLSSHPSTQRRIDALSKM